MPRGGFLRARLRLSKVTPFPSFVIPTTGGSPFFTNSHRPVIKSISINCFTNVTEVVNE